jgi:hypothetical protein
MAEPDRRRWAEEARAALTEGLDRALGEDFRLSERRPRDGAGWIDVAAYDLSTPCPARWSVPGRDDFVLSTRTVAAAVGRLALRDRQDAEAPADAVARVLEQLDGGAFYAEWYEHDLDRAGRAALRAAATTWSIGALASVGGRPLAWAPQRQSVDVDGRMVRLRANWDASDGRARPDVLVVVSTRPQDPARGRLLAGFNALVDGLLRRQLPDRVRLGSAATASTTAVPVTPDLVIAAVDRVVELVAWRAGDRPPPVVVGPWCADCHLLESCDEGTANRAGS